MWGRRRIVVSRKARPRGQRLIHWRYVVYQRLIGVAGMRSYRLWLWNRTIGYRELGRRAHAERAERLAQRERELKKIAYIRRTAHLRRAALGLESEGWRVSGPEGGFVGWAHEKLSR